MHSGELHIFIPSFISSFLLSFLLCCSCGLCGRSGSRIFLPDSTSFTCTGSAVRAPPEDCPHHTATRRCYRFTLVADTLQIGYTRGQHTLKVNVDTVFFWKVWLFPVFNASNDNKFQLQKIQSSMVTTRLPMTQWIRMAYQKFLVSASPAPLPPKKEGINRFIKSIKTAWNWKKLNREWGGKGQVVYGGGASQGSLKC